MRAAIILVALAACTPDVATDTYVCGEQEGCPDGLVCNHQDGLCVTSAASVQPFDCKGAPNTAPNADDTPETGHPITGACVSSLLAFTGCLPAGDTDDWYQLDVPATCTAVQLDAHISFPVSFQEVSLRLVQNGQPVAATAAQCGDMTDETTQLTYCLAAPLAPGAHVALAVERASTSPDCGGKCGFNAYSLSIQLGTPH